MFAMPDAEYVPTDRRPIAVRRLAVMQSLASAIARTGVSPNAISVIGMLAAAAAGALLWATPRLEGVLERAAWLAAAGLVQLRLLCNLFDGMVAIQTGKASPVGELYNEVPDRVSDAAVLIGLGFAAGDPTLGCAAALAAVCTAYVRAVAKVAGAPQDYCGPMAKQQRMFVVTMTAVFCGAAPFAWRGPWVADPPIGAANAALWLILVGAALTSLRRLRRAAGVLRAPRTT